LDALFKFEMDMTTRRLIELSVRPMSGSFDGAHLRSIHRHIFQDVYEWAGEFRTVNISRSGQYPFAFPEQISASIERLSHRLQQERLLEGLDRLQVCSRGAYFLGELNAIHPFRDGNGRAQREFLRQLFARNGFPLSWVHVSREQMTQASRDSFERGDNSAFEKILLACSAL
jgi:cell filamentation protein